MTSLGTNSSTPAVPAVARRSRRRRPLVFAAAALLCLGVAMRVTDLYWPFRHHNMEPLLERVFASHIQMQHYRRIYLPHPGFVADGITLRRNSAPDLPPVGFAQHLRVEGRWLDMLLLRNEVRLVQVNGLHIIIPPVGSRANREDFPPGSSTDFTGPSTFVEQLDLNNAELDIQRAAGGQFAYPIRHLLITDLRMGQTITYDVDMQSAIPSGVIKAHGTFGPLLSGQLGSTPVRGDLTFAPVNLAEIDGISGMLSVSGHFSGSLSAIAAIIHSDTKDFAVGHGRPTAVAVDATGSVSALNGDVLIHSLDARTAGTTVHAQGGILDSPKVATLDLSVIQGRAEDLLRPFLHGRPPVTGAVILHSHATIAAADGQRRFLDRLRMDGNFRVFHERMTNPSVEQKLSAFSRRAQAHPVTPAGNDLAAADSVSDLTATVIVRNGIARAERAVFQVPGAMLNLSGTFDLRNQHTDLTGDLRMETGISHLTTGLRSMLLKPLTPFFRKGKAGTVLPISIRGYPHSYKVRQNMMHHR